MFEVNGDRSSIKISPTRKGWKVDATSLYDDEQDKTYFIAYNNEFPEGTDWGKIINDYGTTNWQLLAARIKDGHVKPYRVIVK